MLPVSFYALLLFQMEQMHQPVKGKRNFPSINFHVINAQSYLVIRNHLPITKKSNMDKCSLVQSVDFIFLKPRN
jgi:hypothetical protein